MNNRENILITGTGSLIGQAIIKSIKKSSLRDDLALIGCDYFENTAGSHWCDKNYILPDLLQPGKEEDWKQVLFSIIDRERIKAVFIGVDFELSYFANLKAEIEKKCDCKVIVSDNRVIDIGNDKYQTYLFLKKHGLNAPGTLLLDEADMDNLQLPVIIKPRQGARSRGVELIKDRGRLGEAVREKRGKGYILQDAIGSTETEYTCGILYWDEIYQDSIILKRTLKEGNTFTAEFHGNEEIQIYSYIRAIGDALKPFGSCNLQLRTDKEGEPFLFEINPRFSGTTYMRALLGYNEVEYIIRKTLSQEVQAMHPKVGKVYRYYEEKLVGVV